MRLAPTSETAHYGLGYALMAKGDIPAAEAELREALRLSPDDDNAHVELGNVLGKKGDCEGEIAEYREAIRLNPREQLGALRCSAVRLVRVRVIGTQGWEKSAKDCA